jgi:hypothetical protein
LRGRPSPTRQPARLGAQQLQESQVDVGRVPVDPARDERAAEDMTRAATIRDIKAGQVEDVVAVVAFNPVEHVADDVTEDIAIAIAGSFDPGEPIPAALRDFIETHAGLDYARGLRVADRSFAAA